MKNTKILHSCFIISISILNDIFECYTALFNYLEKKNMKNHKYQYQYVINFYFANLFLDFSCRLNFQDDDFRDISCELGFTDGKLLDILHTLYFWVKVKICKIHKINSKINPVKVGDNLSLCKLKFKRIFFLPNFF